MEDLQYIMPLVSLLGFLIAASSFYVKVSGDNEKRTKQEAEYQGEQRTLLRNVSEQMIGVSKDMSRLDEKLDTQTERLIRVEESSKQAHKRIDKFENKGC